MEPVSIYDDGVYPGGEYVHKLIVRDYAASMGATRLLEEDLESVLKDTFEKDEENVKLNLDLSMDPAQHTSKSSLTNLSYSVFMDDTDVSVGRGKGRFCTGVLLDPTRLHLKQLLLDMNSNGSKKDDDDDFWSHEYRSYTLPSVGAVIAIFPFTNGFISALIHQFKVFPAMVRFAQERNIEGPIVIATRCNVQESVCTHYIPLEQGEIFLMGQADSATYAKSIPPTNFLDVGPVMKMMKSTFGFGRSTNDDEL